MNTNLRTILPLFLTVFIDALSMGIIFPVLAPLIFSSSGILAPDTSLFMRNFFYGITLSVFPFFMFFSNPILGELSDKIGRKKILIFCLSGVAISYFISVIAIKINSIGLLMVSRGLAGLCAGCISTAQAAIIDVCPPGQKTRYLSLLLFPVSLGFIAGPLFSSLLSNQQWIYWFDLWTPLAFAGLLTFSNLLLLLINFQETNSLSSSKIKLNLHQSIYLFINAFRNPDIRLLSSIFLLFEISWALYFQYISLFMLHKFNYGIIQLGYFSAFSALGFAVSYLYLIPTLSRYYSNLFLLKINLIICAIFTLCSALSPIESLVWLSSFIIGISNAGAYTLSLSLFSNSVAASHQGWIMGITSAISAAALTFAAIITIFLAMLNIRVPLLLAFISLFFTSLLSYKLTSS